MECALTINAINWVLSPDIRLYPTGPYLGKRPHPILPRRVNFLNLRAWRSCSLGLVTVDPNAELQQSNYVWALNLRVCLLPVFRSADARISPAILGVSAAIIFMGKPSSALSLGFIFPLLLFRLSVLEFCGISLRTAIWFLASILVVFFYIFSDLSAALDFLAFGVASSHRTLSYASIFSMLQTLLLAVGLVFTIQFVETISPNR